MNAQDILSTSELLTPENCKIVGDVLYEKLYDHPYNEKYRFFISDDDYDYVEDADLIAKLDELFSEQSP